MPYIAEEKRDQLDSSIDNLHQALVNLELDDEENNMEGNLNYVLTRLLMMVYGNKDGTRYSHINDALGVLEAVKMEYYRKVASSYEDQKEFDNGSIVPFKNHTPEVVGTVDIVVDSEAIKQITSTMQSIKRTPEDD